MTVEEDRKSPETLAETLPETPLTKDQQERRWRMAIGLETADASETQLLSDQDQAMSRSLTALYGDGQDLDKKGKKTKGSLQRSAPSAARWMGDIRQYFPSSVVRVVQKDAFERLGLKQMLMEPEFLEAVEADVNLIADLITMRAVIPEKTKDTARDVVRRVVEQLMERLERKTAEAITGALDRSRRTHRPRFNDIDWPRTIQANLRHYQADYRTIVPETLIGFMRHQKRIVDLDEVVLCVDQSGSMASSVVYASIFAAVMASLPVVQTKLICFDTAVLDLTEELADPVEVLFGVQLGGGTDINQAIAWCQDRIEKPGKCHLVLISDLYEGGDGQSLLLRMAQLVRSGVNVIVLLALCDNGRPSYDPKMAEEMAVLGIPVFSCTPDHFPDLMATALRREDIGAWAAGEDIKLIRKGAGDQA